MAILENVVYVKNLNQQNQLVLDMFAVYAMLCLIFQETWNITWSIMIQSEHFCSFTRSLLIYRMSRFQFSWYEACMLIT